MNSVIKWGRNCGVIGAIIGAIISISNGFQGFFSTTIYLAVLGFIGGVILRKWVFRTFWQ